MKHDETEDKLLEEGDSEQQVDETPGDAFQKSFSDGANRRQSIATEHQGPVQEMTDVPYVTLSQGLAVSHVTADDKTVPKHQPRPGDKTESFCGTLPISMFFKMPA